MTDIEYLKKKNLLIIEFLIEKMPSSIILSEFKKAIISTGSKNNLKGMKNISRDLNAWSNSLPISEKIILEKLLIKNEINEGIEIDNDVKLVLAKCLSNGTIGSIFEYEIINDYLKEVDENDNFYSKISELNKLLKNYIIKF